jgi:hypothetical protein
MSISFGSGDLCMYLGTPSGDLCNNTGADQTFDFNQIDVSAHCPIWECYISNFSVGDECVEQLEKFSS